MGYWWRVELIPRSHTVMLLNMKCAQSFFAGVGGFRTHVQLLLAYRYLVGTCKYSSVRTPRAVARIATQTIARYLTSHTNRGEG